MTILTKLIKINFISNAKQQYTFHFLYTSKYIFLCVDSNIFVLGTIHLESSRVTSFQVLQFLCILKILRFK